jgi:hypothetical protein
MPNMTTEFPDLQRQYDAMWEGIATRDAETSDDTEELEAESDEVANSGFFPTEDECRAVGLSWKKYGELLDLVAKRRIDDRKFN